MASPSLCHDRGVVEQRGGVLQAPEASSLLRDVREISNFEVPGSNQEKVQCASFRVRVSRGGAFWRTNNGLRIKGVRLVSRTV